MASKLILLVDFLVLRVLAGQLLVSLLQKKIVCDITCRTTHGRQTREAKRNKRKKNKKIVCESRVVKMRDGGKRNGTRRVLSHGQFKKI